MASIRKFERHKRGDQLISEHGESPFYPSMSIRTIAKYLSVSKHTAAKIRDNLNRLEILRTMHSKAILLSKDAGMSKRYDDDQPIYRYTIGTRLYERYGDCHEFLQFPIYIKNITLRQYKKHILSSL